MAIDQVLAGILGETVSALSLLKLDKLQDLETRMIELAQQNLKVRAEDAKAALAKKRLLELVLHNCAFNLDSLKRLHARNTRSQWEQ
jgi:hypothetical protein